MSVRIVRNVLKAYQPLLALVPEAQITPLVRPQAIVTPAITIQRISVTPQNHLRGYAQLEANLVQVTAWASTYEKSLAMIDAVQIAMEAAGYLRTDEDEGYEKDVAVDLVQVSQTWQVWTS